MISVAPSSHAARKWRFPLHFLSHPAPKAKQTVTSSGMAWPLVAFLLSLRLCRSATVPYVAPAVVRTVDSNLRSAQNCTPASSCCGAVGDKWRQSESKASSRSPFSKYPVHLPMQQPAHDWRWKQPRPRVHPICSYFDKSPDRMVSPGRQLSNRVSEPMQHRLRLRCPTVRHPGYPQRHALHLRLCERLVF